MSAAPGLFWMIVDGLPLWLLERFRGERRMLPTLAALFDDGRVTGLAPVSPNCQTPPSLFTLFSGTPPEVHGLSGFDVPRGPSPLAVASAFEAFPAHLPLLWTEAAREGRSLRLCQIPFVDPDALGSGLVQASYGFGRPVVDPAVIPLRAEAERQPAPAFGPGAEIEGGQADGAILHRPGAAPTALPRGAWTAVGLAGGETTLACLLDRDGEPAVVMLGAWAVRRAGSAPPEEFPALPFVGGGLAALFRSGAFGRTIVGGGAGAAEAALFDAVRALGRRFWGEALVAQARGDAGVVVAYQPAYDLLFHEILGLIDGASRHHRPAEAALVDGLLLRALRDVDAALAALMAGDDGRRLVVASDHGMKPVDTVLLPNAVLRRRGWLATTPDGTIDPAASVAFFHPAETGLVCFNDGLLAAAGLEAEAVMDALADECGRSAGRPARWFTRDLPGLVLPGFTARHYLSPGRLQTAKADLGPACARPSNKTADHAAWADDPQLVGIVADLSRHAVPGLQRMNAAAGLSSLLTAPPPRAAGPA